MAQRSLSAFSPKCSLRNSLLGKEDHKKGGRAMTRQFVHHSRGGVRKVRLAEVAGGTAAECAAVCCCCPCGVVNLLVLAVYKLPAGLCRKALRRKRHRRLIKQGLLPPRQCSCNDNNLEIHPISCPVTMVNALESNPDKDVIELEKEMWDKFYSAGFWRSSSQRSDM